MTRIPRLHLPVRRPTDVIPYLGAPHHYRAGRSAQLIAESWFSAHDLPEMIRVTLGRSSAGHDSPFADAELVDAFLERRIELGDGLKPSQADVLAILGIQGSLAVMAVEGKVDETFGPTVNEWLNDASDQKRRRLVRLADTLGLDSSTIGSVRYQLLHRTASAVYEAHRYRARMAIMMVHSFDAGDAGAADFKAFAGAMRIAGAEPTRIAGPVRCESVDLYLGWTADSPSNEGFSVVEGRKTDSGFFHDL